MVTAPEIAEFPKYPTAVELANVHHSRPIHGVHEAMFPAVTPVRVMHRRALMSRKKTIHSVKVLQWVNPHFFVIAIESSAGTYIKEFVHGDLGRTNPNIGSLLGGGGEADILQLDVLSLVV